MGSLYTVQLEKFVLNALRRNGSGRDLSILGTRGSMGTTWGSVITRGSDTIVVLDARVQHQGTEQAGDEDEEEREERKGKDLLRQWSRQLRYQLRVQAVTRARRVKEERSGNRRVVGEVMSLAGLRPGVDRSRDRDSMARSHDIWILRAENTSPVNSTRHAGCTQLCSR